MLDGVVLRMTAPEGSFRVGRSGFDLSMLLLAVAFGRLMANPAGCTLEPSVPMEVVEENFVGYGPSSLLAVDSVDELDRFLKLAALTVREG